MKTNDPVVNIIERYKTHPNTILTKEHTTQLDDRFSFEQILYEDIHKGIRKLDCTKASQDIDIPTASSKKILIFLQTSSISFVTRQYPTVNSQQALKKPLFYQSIKKIQD